MKIKNLIQMNDGFFKSLYSQTTPIFQTYFSDSELDLMFFSNYGNKTISPLVENLLDEDGTLSDTNKNQLSMTIYDMNKYKYDELFKVLSIIETDGGWDPTENYSLKVSENGSTSYGKTQTITRTGTDATESGGSDTVETTGTDTFVKTGSQSVENEIEENSSTSKDSRIPFNSDEETETLQNSVVNTNKDKSDTTFNSITDTNTKNLSNDTVYGRTDTTTHNTQDSTTDGGTDTDTRTRTEHGSMGVSSAIDQVLKNFEGFTKTDFFRMILDDFSSMTTLSIFNVEEE